jgi:transposase
MGRSRGGLTTKIHALVDANGLPILLKLTLGQAHDGRSADDMLASLGEGQILLADRGSDSDALRARVARQGAWGNIKPMPHRVNVPSFSAYLYRFRNLVNASSINSSISAPSRPAEKHNANDLAVVELAAIRIWFRFMSRWPRAFLPDGNDVRFCRPGNHIGLPGLGGGGRSPTKLVSDG